MKKFILICLCNAALLLVLCSHAEARVTIGLTVAGPLSGVSQSSADLFGEELARQADTAFTVRLFNDEANLGNWLLRFQELDAAIVSRGYLKQQPAGTLLHLADLHGPQGHNLTLVTRNNLPADRLTAIKGAFLKIGEGDRGRQALEKLELVAITRPGERPRRTEAAKKPSPQPAVAAQPEPAAVERQPAPLVTEEKADVKLPPPVKEEKAPVLAQRPPEVDKARAEARGPALEKPQPPTDEQQRDPQGKAPSAQEEPAGNERGTLPAGSPPEEASEPPKPAQKAAIPEPERVAPQPKAEPDKRLTIFIALVILLAILFKICLFALRWQGRRQAAFRPEDTPTVEEARGEKATAGPRPAKAAPEGSAKAGKDPDEDSQVVEEGRLGPGKLPALLKRCADLPAPVVLQVIKGKCEKLVYFAGGQVAAALTQNATEAESGVRWNKLGNLLVREGLITGEQFDQGMAMVTRQPELRFGEALLKLGLIDLAGLRHALTRQAKVTIYSLILFPEGRYRVIAGDGSLPAEESVSLEVTNLIREASHHQSEWTAIRHALPNLNTALDFSSGGREKLEKVSLSPQQEAILDLIDGKRSINDLCVESTMMDYEVYRFLYLMVKAGVLR